MHSAIMCPIHSILHALSLSLSNFPFALQKFYANIHTHTWILENSITPVVCATRIDILCQIFFIYNFNESNELSKFSMQVIGNRAEDNKTKVKLIKYAWSGWRWRRRKKIGKRVSDKIATPKQVKGKRKCASIYQVIHVHLLYGTWYEPECAMAMNHRIALSQSGNVHLTRFNTCWIKLCCEYRCHEIRFLDSMA